jgi:hypothetical protein
MRQRQYKETKVKDRRSIVRALNTFSEQYDYIYCNNNKTSFNLDTDRLELIFSNELSKYINNIVYSKSDARIELSKYDNIINTIDNLMSINRKLLLKQELKDLVEITIKDKLLKKSKGGYTSAFFDEDKKENMITQISYLVNDNIKFATKLYNQIKNRIQYKNLDLYQNNSNTKINANNINLTYLTQQDLFNNQIAFIKQHLWLFNTTQMNTLRKGIENGNFNFLYDHHNEIIANEWIEHYEKISKDQSEFTKYIYPRIVNSLTEIFTQFEILKFNKIYTKKGNIVQVNKYIQNVQSDIIKKVKDRKMANNIYRELKKLWLSMNTTLTEKFHSQLINIYYIDIDYFGFDESRGFKTDELYYGDFMAELYYQQSH